MQRIQFSSDFTIGEFVRCEGYMGAAAGDVDGNDFVNAESTERSIWAPLNSNVFHSFNFSLCNEQKFH